MTAFKIATRVLAAIAVTGVKLASASIVSTSTTLPPAIDGAAPPSEWSLATSFALAHGTLMAQHDSSNLYLLADLTADTGNDPLSGDWFWLTFDVDRNASITRNVDVNYGVVSSSPNYFQMQYYLGPGSWTGPHIPVSRGVRGFGPSLNSSTSHRIWEYAIDLPEIAAHPGDTVRMGLRTRSAVPAFNDSLPAGFISDFTSLLEITLVPEPATFMLMALGGLVMMRRRVRRGGKGDKGQRDAALCYRL